MTFAAPIWLLALVPWAGVVLYLVWGRRPRVDVPFLELWPAHGEGVRVRRRATPPPVALALAILAALLAILAAGRPGVRWSGAGPTVSVVLDRGYTMSGREAGGDSTRLVDAVNELSMPLQQVSLLRPMERVLVPGPGPERSETSDLIDGPAMTPTALDTRDALRIAVRSALARGPGPVIVVSDQDPGMADGRVIRVPPARAVRNARIVTLAARETPAAQVMVRVRGGAGIERTTLRVTSGVATPPVEQMLELPAGGDATDAFIDLPKPGQSIKAELLVEGDDQPADDTAWLVREASWPRIEPRLPLPAAVQRMLDVYARERPPTDASRRVAIVSSPDQLPAGEAGVVLALERRGSATSPDAIVVADHPIMHGVRFSDVGDAVVARADPPAGFAPVVTAGGKVWVAVRDEPIRIVWVGFDSDAFGRSTAFVVFWANVLNWAGEGGEQFASYPVGSLETDVDWTPVELAGSPAPPEPKLWPGLYRRADGTLRALNAPDVPLPPVGETDWRERIARIAEGVDGRSDVSPAFIVLALACLAGSAGLWKRKGNPVPGVT
jgi:hypothetical protein